MGVYLSFPDEQHNIYDKIMLAVTNKKCGVFFLHDYGGTGKTYTQKTLATFLRATHKIVLTVAYSGIAYMLLPGGRTTHSKLKILVPTMENSTCKIDFDNDHIELHRQMKLIIWDEAHMARKFYFEALDKTLRDVMSNYSNFDQVFRM